MKNFTLYIFSLLAFLCFCTTRAGAQNDDQHKDTTIYISIFRQYELITEANRGNAIAQHTLGLCYLNGFSFPADTQKAVYWIKKAADNNLPAAHYNYGVMLYNGTGVDWNPFEAYKHVMRAASVKMKEALYLAGIFYTDNLVVPRDDKKAQYYFDSFADTLHKKPDTTGSNVSEVIVDSQSITIAREIQELANKDADYNSYGNMLIQRLFSGKITKDFSEIIKDTAVYRKITEQAAAGNSDAQVLLGLCYEKGITLRQDDIMALEYYFRSISLDSKLGNIFLIKFYHDRNTFETKLSRINAEVRKNNPAAMYVIYSLTAAGLNNSITSGEAFEILKKAALAGHLPSVVELGLCYFRGRFVKRDSDKAMEFFRFAASKGYGEAGIWMANLNIQEKFTYQPSSETLSYLAAASEKGIMHAQVLLGYCYEKGLGVDTNPAKAAKLYRAALAHGNKGAYTALRRMHDKLRPGSPDFAIKASE
ncbi:MAG: tetratricopeptide repeat protein [Bacteroidota bacterium]